ncbi:hypothetical protein FOZ62_017865 [Perkinsus olseni]|uniref:Uncharacterized protein n=1 Tax=Perkinsus olseni TaxID=32597 RepID=A0A7J6S1F4_PEROL|nr:hypothetical protein FOZ62_017865 [Perkinsus olseni]
MMGRPVKNRRPPTLSGECRCVVWGLVRTLEEPSSTGTMKTSVKYAYTRDDFRFDETEEGSSHVIGGSLLHAYADLTPGVLGDVSFLKLAGLSECCGYLWKAHDWTWEAGVIWVPEENQ